MIVQIQLLLQNQTKEKKDYNIHIYLFQHLLQVVNEFSKNDIPLFLYLFFVHYLIIKYKNT